MSLAAEADNLLLNYFTTTLGQAAGQPPSPFSTVNDLIDQQAHNSGEKLACGWPSPGETSSDWGCKLFTFGDLYLGSLAAAQELRNLVPTGDGQSPKKCVALVCASSIDFLFVWLGLMRAGSAVLLIAPQCPPEAIAHLCKSCEATLLIHDHAHESLASAAQSHCDQLRIEQIPWRSRGVNISSLTGDPATLNDFPPVDQYDTAYIHHTSGTSSGLPKPIPQTHRAGVGVLPALNGSDAATFTTTPLYHGGVADCFRAWTSSAMIWLFPGDKCPITTNNILSSIDAASRESSKSPSVPPIKYFSSVPYVLQMLGEDPAGIRTLERMDIVGVGGAALPSQVGDDLVSRGVNLVSRFGSAECGFLLSSHRQYELDKEWQYLRLPPQSDDLIRFESRPDSEGLSELIVLSKWPHMAKRNQTDRSFATSDLFEPHPTIPNAWKYHSRSDSQITLLTGKKFDPAPVEDEIASRSALVREVLVFGDGQQVPGALVFLASAPDTEKLYEEEIWKIVQAVNTKGQNHTRISRANIKILHSSTALLSRSSKGTILRGAANKTFSRDIKQIYEQKSTSGDHDSTITDDDVKHIIKELVDRYYPDHVTDDDIDFYKAGMDSAACTQIRTALQNKLLLDGQKLPWNIVYDCGNIERLSQFIVGLRQGQQSRTDSDQERMLDLVHRYSGFEHVDKGVDTAQPDLKTVLLTGATGALGAHILGVLRQDPTVAQVVCLVRAASREAARTRVSESLVKRQQDFVLTDDIQCFAAEFEKQDLGLGHELICMLRRNVTHVIHAAWNVNFSLPLRSFEDDNIAGLQKLIKLAKVCQYPVQFTFCSSTASILGKAYATAIPEKISNDPTDSDKLGYSRSKWVAEQICAVASKELRGSMNILRIGQLTGDTVNGIWNMSEAWPTMLSTVDAVGCLPERTDSLSWLPLDIAARAIVEITLGGGGGNTREENCEVFHIVNNSTEASWQDLLSWIAEVQSMPFDRVELAIWIRKVRDLDSHPAQNLLWLWTEDGGGRKDASDTDNPVFEITKAQARSKAMCSVEPVSRDLVQKIWRWVESEMS